MFVLLLCHCYSLVYAECAFVKSPVTIIHTYRHTPSLVYEGHRVKVKVTGTKKSKMAISAV